MKNKLYQILASVSLAATATPGMAAVDFAKAQAGLETMRQLNAVVLGNMGMTGNVQGKLFVGGILGGAGVVAAGSGNGQGFAASPMASLSVGGNLGGSAITVANGIGLPAVQVEVGGNAVGLRVNAASSLTKVGGLFNNQGFLPDAGKLVRYGTTALNVTPQQQAFVTKDAALATGGSNDLKAALATTRAVFASNFGNLSEALGELSVAANPSSVTNGPQGVVFNAVKGGNAFALFDIDAALLASSQIAFNVAGDAFPIIVNVTGANVTWSADAGSGFDETLNQRIIWNFLDATTVDLQKIVHGSVLAANASVSNSAPIEGSLVAKSFTQGGEVRLGTFAGGIQLGAAVPEPASWALMVAGFGLIGAASRRRGERVVSA